MATQELWRSLTGFGKVAGSSDQLLQWQTAFLQHYIYAGRYFVNKFPPPLIFVRRGGGNLLTYPHMDDTLLV